MIISLIAFLGFCENNRLTTFTLAPEDLERLAEEKLTQGGWSVSFNTTRFVSY